MNGDCQYCGHNNSFLSSLILPITPSQKQYMEYGAYPNLSSMTVSDPLKEFRNILVGVTTTVLNESGEMLVSRRLEGAKTGIGKLSSPGGCLEENETIFDCSKRETLEETGLVVTPFEISGSIVFHTIERFLDEGNLHVITLCVASRVESGELCNNEPLKHSNWTWVTLEQLQTLSAPTDDWIPVQKLTLLREYGYI